MSSSSFRNHRIIIASLFLPHTVVIGSDTSGKSTPRREDSGATNARLFEENEGTAASGEKPSKGHASSKSADVSVPEMILRLHNEKTSKPSFVRAASTIGTPKLGPLKSIVEDLTDRSRNPTTPAATTGTPANENPFFKITTPGLSGLPPSSSAQDTVDSPSGLPPTATAPHLTATTPSSPSQRTSGRKLHRKTSRSSSRRPGESGGGLGATDEVEELPFHVEPNPHCNGGLKNAIDSVSAAAFPAGTRANAHNRTGSASSFNGGGGGNRMRKKLWVGTLGAPDTNSYSSKQKQRVSARMRGEHEGEVVWIEDGVFERCYDGFCHQALWPALHYAVPDAPRTKLFYESASFDDYVAVNRHFAEVIKSVWREGDVVWVNDYHLMLLPSMLRSEGGIPSWAPIGFFMHVAFPSSEIFRCLSVRESLLRGVLGADLIGFQTASYARHFRQTVSRILAVEALPRGIQLGAEFDFDMENKVRRGLSLSGDFADAGKENGGKGGSGSEKGGDSVGEGSGKGRFVDVGVFPMGIDVKQLMEKRREAEVDEWISVLKQRYAGMKILVGRDKLDEIQGVRQKIQAFEVFLDKYPTFQEKVVLIQIALPSPTPEDSDLNTTSDSYSVSSTILTPISHINSRYSTLTYQPVVFLHTQDVNFSQYLALLSVADAFIVTSLREGMALRGHEYVVMQKERRRPLVLSEFTGSYSYSGFRSCIAVNPWDARGTAAAINEALTMSDDEANSRWEDLHNHVITQTAQAFVTSFLNRVLRANGDRLQSSTYGFGGDAYGAGDADGSRGVVERGRGAEVPSLSADMGRVVGRWRHSARRLVMVDWEGTLVPSASSLLYGAGSSGTVVEKGENPEQENVAAKEKERVEREVNGEKAIKEAIEVLKKLAENKRNEVWLLSGFRVKGVLSRIAQEVPNLGIVAENGCFIRPRPSRGFPSPDWMNMVSNLNMTWKSICLEMLNYFTERTPGSFIEEREASVVWRFWTGSQTVDSSDRQWARRQAAEAQNHIFDSLGERYGLRIIPGTNSFLILPNNISRSTAVGAILQPGGPARSPISMNSRAPWMSPDVDAPNVGEDLDFALAVSADEKLLRRLNELDNSETCSTSGKGTDAKWRVEPEEVNDVLRRFADVAA